MKKNNLALLRSKSDLTATQLRAVAFDAIAAANDREMETVNKSASVAGDAKRLIENVLESNSDATVTSELRAAAIALESAMAHLRAAFEALDRSSK